MFVPELGIAYMTYFENPKIDKRIALTVARICNRFGIETKVSDLELNEEEDQVFLSRTVYVSLSRGLREEEITPILHSIVAELGYPSWYEEYETDPNDPILKFLESELEKTKN